MSDNETTWVHPRHKGQATPFHANVVNLRCPICRHLGAFTGFDNISDVQVVQPGPPDKRNLSLKVGLRVCPNNQCRAVVFVVLTGGGTLIKVYPPEIIDFDSANLPENILATLEEAIRCFAAECYKATALMVRRVLEELCENRGASGPNLKARLSSLSASVVLPKELLDAADELRLLGNDAAHVEAKEYDAIGRVEATLSLELAKELLKAVYQYGSLLGKLRSLKKASP